MVNESSPSPFLSFLYYTISSRSRAEQARSAWPELRLLHFFGGHAASCSHSHAFILPLTHPWLARIFDMDYEDYIIPCSTPAWTVPHFFFMSQAGFHCWGHEGSRGTSSRPIGTNRMTSYTDYAMYGLVCCRLGLRQELASLTSPRAHYREEQVGQPALSSRHLPLPPYLAIDFFLLALRRENSTWSRRQGPAAVKAHAHPVAAHVRQLCRPNPCKAWPHHH